jgi:hypothetical protein
VKRVGAPVGDEDFVFTGALAFAAGRPAVFDPATSGAQVLLEDLGSGGGAIFELSHRTTPVPGGSGCERRDGWRGARYTNRSGRIDPPACPADSANGLRSLRFKDQRAKGKGIAFAAIVRHANLGQPVGPFRVTVVTGASPVSSVVGDCSTHAFTACVKKRTTLTCR